MDVLFLLEIFFYFTTKSDISKRNYKFLDVNDSNFVHFAIENSFQKFHSIPSSTFSSRIIDRILPLLISISRSKIIVQLLFRITGKKQKEKEKTERQKAVSRATRDAIGLTEVIQLLLYGTFIVVNSFDLWVIRFRVSRIMGRTCTDEIINAKHAWTGNPAMLSTCLTV